MAVYYICDGCRKELPPSELFDAKFEATLKKASRGNTQPVTWNADLCGECIIERLGKPHNWAKN